MMASIADATIAEYSDSPMRRRVPPGAFCACFRVFTPAVYPNRRLTQIKHGANYRRENVRVRTRHPVESLERLKQPERAINLREKVAHLSRPESYPEKPAAVEVVQTHMSVVFLTEHHAWKLKKPVRYDFLDFSTLDARRADCEEELRLNRRLARDVYLEVVRLAVGPQGALRLAGDGPVVDWLVKMRRLPAHLMLDDAIRRGGVTRPDVRRFTLALAGFYSRAEPVVIEPAQYRQRFERDIRANRDGLSPPEYSMPAALVQSIATRQLSVLAREASMFDARVTSRRIVECHGDLRPEHICLEPEPLFIDCLEFNRDWRLLDPADELAYLAVECEYAGAPWIGEVVFETYREATGDDPPALLVRFYKAYRATVRAKLSAWHLKDHPDQADQGKWVARALRYLELADRYASH
jgi:aminoglycoside phosphotransferase family enzyme